MSKSTVDLAELILSVYPNIRRVFRHLVSLKEVPISMTQLTCLSIITKQQTLTMSSLAENLSMSNQQLTKVVDTLQDFGLVERVTDAKNRRQIFVSATEKGKNLMQSLQKEIDRKLTFVFRSRKEGEIDSVYDALAYIASYFVNAEE